MLKTYLLSTFAMIISSVAFAQTQLIRGGERFIEPESELTSNMIEFVSPLVLDLDGNEVETINMDGPHRIYFDHDSNGFKERTGFVGPNDGLLAIDLNGDGIINSGGELFGNNTFIGHNLKAADGFEALAELDDNRDGEINYLDSGFNKLLVFRDDNSDGVSNKAELLTLSELEIESIAVDYTNGRGLDNNQNDHRQIGSYRTNDGVEHEMVDVWFRFNTIDTYKITLPSFSEEILSLPDARGFGLVPSLHEAMHLDSSGRLRLLVTAYVNARSRYRRDELLPEIIFAWTGQNEKYSPYPDLPPGYEVDARKIAALDLFYGKPIGRPQGEKQQYQSYVEALFEEEVDKLHYSLASKTYLRSYMSFIAWRKNEKGDYVPELYDLVIALAGTISEDEDYGKEILQDVIRALRGQNIMSVNNINKFRSDVMRVEEQIRLAFLIQENDSKESLKRIKELLKALEVIQSELGFGDENLVGAYSRDFISGGPGKDNITGGFGNDWIDGGLGDDILIGDGSGFLFGEYITGDDTYYYRLGDGNDVIRELDEKYLGLDSGVDRIIFSQTILPSEVSFDNEGNNLRISFKDHSTMLIESFFSYPQSSINELHFEVNGEIWNRERILKSIQ